MTPASCSASCSGTGGVIVCNGQVVYVASTIVDAGQWYVAHLDQQFNTDVFKVSASATCTGDDCSAKAICATSPGANKVDGTGFLLAGLAFVGVGAARRRKSRR
jgi:hypothetical protein